jgi:hypothetical protein
MFKIEETGSEDGEIIGAIFMRADGMFEARIYREDPDTSKQVSTPSDYEVYAITGTLDQARRLVHEELGCSGNGCDYCNFP